MKSIKKPGLLFIIIALGFFSSCNDMSKRVEDKINELENKAVELDSMVNKEMDKVMELDTLIDLEKFKVKKLDSLIEKNASKIDSIASDKMQELNEMVN